MEKKPFVLGVVTARGGSKGIRDKNIVELAGKPLISYAIRSALRSKLLSDLIVSTDSEKIASVAKRFGAAVPFMRPKELGRDETPSLPVLKHAVREYESVSGKRVDIVVLLQPTSPFRTAEHIDSGIQLLLDKEADSVFSVAPLEVSPNWLFKIESGELKFAFGRDFSKIRRQDTGSYYRIHGLLRVYRKEVLLSAREYAVGEKVVPLVTSKRDSMEIDSPEDLEVAEALLRDAKGSS